MSDCPEPLLGFSPAGATGDSCGIVGSVSGWCDANGFPVDVHYVRDCETLVLSVFYTDPSTGSTVVPTFPLQSCAGSGPSTTVLRDDVFEVPASSSLSFPAFGGNLVSITVVAPNGATLQTATTGPVTLPSGTFTYNTGTNQILSAPFTVTAPAGGSVFVLTQEA